MLILRLWNYIRGYVIIIVKGYFLEKFINICTRRQILLWDIKVRGSGVMTLKISIKGFKMLRPIAKKTNCSVRILRKKGLPFVFSRYRRRKAFVAGAVLFVFLLYVLTSFIWSVEITGNENIETAVIEQKLAENGVKAGKLKYNIDTDRVANSMMLAIDQLRWISITIKGTKAKIQVAERVLPPELVPMDQPCNIVARRDGVISSIVVKEGYAAVKPGDTVIKGQMLVSGSIPIKGEEERKRLVHAIATVEARTWYEESCEVKTKITEKKRTGNVLEHKSIELFTKRIKLFPKKIEFDEYDKIETEKRISLGGDLVLPFAIVTERFYESTEVEKELSLEEAKQLAADTAYKKALEKIPDGAKIVKPIANFKEDENGNLTAHVIIECLEEIGIEEKIGGE
ncbi:MAG TPA: sporulation protein YqfD [Clostridiaceae bacterium]|nr:sporulation protein YqfD [Clostridiaceae bacterium]